MFTLTTLFVIAGGIAASVGVVALTSDGKGGSSDGSVANNPFSEWDFHQPYNP
jgi:hypothetical protein